MNMIRVIAALSVFSLFGCETVGQNPREEMPSQSDPEMLEYCETNACRGHTRVFLRTDGDDFIMEMSQFWPVVQNGAISALPGETLYVEAQVSEGQLINLVSVPEIVSPENTLEIKFSQDDDDVGMMLIVRNPFDVPIKFNMDMMNFRGDLYPTSSCPVMPGASIYEMWPHPIVQIFIANPRVIDMDGTVSCEY